MTDLVEIVPPAEPPTTIPLRRDRPIYQYGEFYVGMADSLKAKHPNYIWLGYNSLGKLMTYAATRNRILLQLDAL